MVNNRGDIAMAGLEAPADQHIDIPGQISVQVNMLVAEVNPTRVRRELIY